MIRFKRAYKISFYRSASLGEPFLSIESGSDHMLRVAFSVNKSNTIYQTANTLKLKIYNLAQGTREAINDYGDYVILRAGWGDAATSPIIYQGSIIAANHTVRPPDAITEINCLDESAALFRLRNKKPNISVNASVSISALIRSIAKDAELTIALLDVPQNAILVSGYCSDDKTISDVLCDLANRASCNYKVIDNKIYIYSLSLKDSTLPYNGYVDVREETGMIGYPQRFGYNILNPIFFGSSEKKKPSTWAITTQLNGSLNLLGGVRLTCPALKVVGQEGIVVALKHTGDTHGGTWQSQANVYEK